MAQRFAALDTDFLIKVRDNNPDAEGVFDWLTSLGAFPLVSEAVVQDLENMARFSEDPDDRQAAESTLALLPIWGCLCPQLAGINNDIACRTAQKIIDTGALGETAALVVAQAAVEDCVLLITGDESILNAAEDHLKLVLIESHVSDVVILNLDEILEYLRGKNQDPEFPG